jgi:hypothetical protein
MNEQRRSTQFSDSSAGDRCFVRWLCLTLVIVSSIGAMIVLIDPVITFAASVGRRSRSAATVSPINLRGRASRSSS